MALTKQWILAERPVGIPETSHFRLEEIDIAPPAPGEVIVRVEYHTVAPGVRAKLTGATYAAGVQIGGVIPAVGVGVVEQSADSALQPGDLVFGELGWAERMRVPAASLERLDRGLFGGDLPVSAALSTLGPPGLTAFFDIAMPQRGETVVVSSAAGGVGSMVGQIAKLSGCRVVGIAGSERKCAILTERFGFDAAIDYRAEDELPVALRQATPDGANIYFDNVGGEISDVVFGCMAVCGRIVLCGLTSEYNRPSPRGFRNIQPFISSRLSLRSFILWDYRDRFAEARTALAGWTRDGAVHLDVRIADGIESSAEMFACLFTSNEAQQTLVRVSELADSG
jgi:NADPH-dependent curcumin reductase CurA